MNVSVSSSQSPRLCCWTLCVATTTTGLISTASGENPRTCTCSSGSRGATPGKTCTEMSVAGGGVTRLGEGGGCRSGSPHIERYRFNSHALIVFQNAAVFTLQRAQRGRQRARHRPVSIQHHFFEIWLRLHLLLPGGQDTAVLAAGGCGYLSGV